MKEPRNSFSLLDGHAFCGRRTWFDRTGPRKETLPMRKGTQVHGAFENLIKAKIAGESWDELYNLETSKRFIPEGPHKMTKVRWWLSSARPLLEKTLPIRVERWFDVEVNGTQICGRIDFESARIPSEPCEGIRISGIPANGYDCDRPCVLDFKTVSSARWCKTPDQARQSMQLALYCIVTGFDHAGFVYLLPNMDVEAVIVEVPQNAKAIAARWICMQSEAFHRTWQEAVEMVDEPENLRDIALLDMSKEQRIVKAADLWQPASFLHPWCSPKCDHWEKCYGDLKKGRM